ncbi:MAG TPA: peptide deformylase [Nitrospinaceae bacterium]|jgi:peptide deformylase|nr:peptide deformylase [Nitrospinaceae bacterium]
MSVLKVAKLGNPVLRQVAAEVDLKGLVKPKGELQKFIDDMIETMHKEGGVGLAAPQVNRSIKIVVLEYDNNERYPEESSIPLTVLVNPVLSDFSGEKVLGWESCLSLIDFRGLVPRFTSLTLTAYDRQGKKIEKRVEGFEAVVLQHEIDHLEGKVFLDRMEDFSKLSYQEEFEEFWVKKDPAPESRES